VCVKAIVTEDRYQSLIMIKDADGTDEFLELVDWVQLDMYQ